MKTGTLTERLDAWARTNDASVAIARNDHGEWVVSLEWGQEAPDSPMVGAAAYGLNEELDLALVQALEEAGV